MQLHIIELSYHFGFSILVDRLLQSFKCWNEWKAWSSCQENNFSIWKNSLQHFSL